MIDPTQPPLADCPARLAFDLLSNTWASVVPHALRSSPRRPAELLEMIGGIRSKVLTETLRRLQRDGLLTRRAYAEAPPRVTYELTELGSSLLAPIDALACWAHQHGDEVLDAQLRAATG